MEGLPAGSIMPSERERVLQSMAEITTERGYAETRIDAVIERAGVPAEAFEQLFPGGKEECMVGAVDAVLSEVFQAVSASYSADHSQWDSTILGIKAILELMAANPSFAHLSYVVSRQMSPAGVFQAYDSGIRLLASMLDRLRETAGEDAQPPSAARGALGGAEATVRRELSAGRADRLPSLVPDFVYAATVPYLGQERALSLAGRARQLTQPPDDR